METVLDGNTGLIKQLGDKTVANSLAKAIDTINTKFAVAAVDIEIQKTDYDKIKTEVDTITTTIDKTLETGGLTQLDTANLKALRAAVLDIKSTFENIDGIKQNGVDKYTVAVDDLDKVKESLGKLVKEREEVGESSTKALESSRAQAETISEMRGQLQAFAANPKGSELESANFTGYLETVDAALSNISDQRAKLGASQNRLEYTINNFCAKNFFINEISILDH